MPDNPIFCALDRPDLQGALALARDLADCVGGLKLGLEFFCAQGPGGVRAVAAAGLPLFLDLKLHDIPNTVAGAVRAVAELGAAYLTVHAGGGETMLRAAAAVRPRPALLAVSVLTSLDAADLQALGVAAPPAEHAVRLARLAAAAGVEGIVCSPHEIAAVRAAVGPHMLICAPGIRPQAGTDDDDQKRVLTPMEARRAGADMLVIGRPITTAPDPAAAARVIAAALPEAARHAA